MGAALTIVYPVAFWINRSLFFQLQCWFPGYYDGPAVSKFFGSAVACYQELEVSMRVGSSGCQCGPAFGSGMEGLLLMLALSVVSSGIFAAVAWRHSGNRLRSLLMALTIAAIGQTLLFLHDGSAWAMWAAPFVLAGLIISYCMLGATSFALAARYMRR